MNPEEIELFEAVVDAVVEFHDETRGDAKDIVERYWSTVKRLSAEGSYPPSSIAAYVIEDRDTDLADLASSTKYCF